MGIESWEQADKDEAEWPYAQHVNEKLEFIRNRVTELRLSEELSERALSLDIGKSDSYIRQVSSGKITPALVPLIQICERLSVDLSEFFDPDFHNPDLLHTAFAQLKKLSDEDIAFLIVLMKKLEKP